MKKTLFTREYESVKNPRPESVYSYFPSGEDRIWDDLEKECIALEGDHFDWCEGSTLTHINIHKIVIITQPKYTRSVYVQTMGADAHPEGLLAILAKHQFTREKPQ